MGRISTASFQLVWPATGLRAVPPQLKGDTQERWRCDCTPDTLGFCDSMLLRDFTHSPSISQEQIDIALQTAQISYCTCEIVQMSSLNDLDPASAHDSSESLNPAQQSSVTPCGREAETQQQLVHSQPPYSVGADLSLFQYAPPLDTSPFQPFPQAQVHMADPQNPLDTSSPDWASGMASTHAAQTILPILPLYNPNAFAPGLYGNFPLGYSVHDWGEGLSSYATSPWYHQDQNGPFSHMSDGLASMSCHSQFPMMNPDADFRSWTAPTGTTMQPYQVSTVPQAVPVTSAFLSSEPNIQTQEAQSGSCPQDSDVLPASSHVVTLVIDEPHKDFVIVHMYAIPKEARRNVHQTWLSRCTKTLKIRTDDDGSVWVGGASWNKHPDWRAISYQTCSRDADAHKCGPTAGISMTAEDRAWLLDEMSRYPKRSWKQPLRGPGGEKLAERPVSNCNLPRSKYSVWI